VPRQWTACLYIVHAPHPLPPRKPYIQNLHRSRWPWERLQGVKRLWTACIYTSQAHLAPAASPLPPTNPACSTLPAIERFPPRTAGGTARRVHRPHTSSSRTNPTVRRSTTDARSLSQPAHPHMACRSLPPTRARATYLACAVRHTSTSSVVWIAANVVHVAAGERGRARGLCARLCARMRLRWAGSEWVQCHSVPESDRVQHTATVSTPALLHCQGWENGRRWWKAAVRGSHAQSSHIRCWLHVDDTLLHSISTHGHL